MIIRGTDSTGDWTFGTGKGAYKRELDALMLNIETRLKEWKYDCFFNEAAGIDYKNHIGIGSDQLLAADVKRVVLQSYGVLSILSFSLSIGRDTRELTIQVNISTIYGDVNDFSVTI